MRNSLVSHEALQDGNPIPHPSEEKVTNAARQRLIVKQGDVMKPMFANRRTYDLFARPGQDTENHGLKVEKREFSVKENKLIGCETVEFCTHVVFSNGQRRVEYHHSTTLMHVNCCARHSSFWIVDFVTVEMTMPGRKIEFIYLKSSRRAV